MEILKKVEEISEELDELRKFIYENPELGFEEYKSSKAHIDLLKKHGFEIECPYMGCETSFKAVYDSKKKGRTVSYLSEYDALPGIGHGCGHNILGATATGAGIVLSKLIGEIGGRVIVFGTAAEEVGGTKIEIANSDELKDVDVAIEMHPASYNSLTPNSLALSTRRFEFFGKTSHASDAPEKGINALDAQIVLFSAINALRQETKDGTRIHGIIKDGGKAANIIPDYTDSRFYARSPEKKDLLEILEKLENCAKGAALATGCEVKISEYEKGNDNTVRNNAFNAVLKEKLEKYLDEEIKDIELNKGSTDAGNFSHEVPTIHGYFKIADESVNGHTVELRDATMTDYAFSQMKKVIAAIVEVGITILTDDEAFEKIMEEFKENVKSGKIIPHSKLNKD
ncbi:M20 family metallopeptidase [Peptoniphilus sp. AGMB00490]|uniref:Peptidase M20 domain-containing protein 2 n=1 Tax=Peptoniphilus faecalis TaxID=2731255 RepID=A0A848RIH6_9FIRM|nr:M20 family metallopeptidase [Peptoniphilus faecalis]NMW85219.1 M20 family metallopeptidase [Peptoniphilus faecalis]